MAIFTSLHTQFALEALTEAELTGVPITLTEMAVGDGNGNEIIPSDGMTALVRERYRAAINRVYKPDPVGYPTLYYAELVIPYTEGGFTMREVGVFDADGNLFVVGNLPETYKPDDTEGAFGDTVIRVSFETSNAPVINLVVDPTIAVATQQWVMNNVNTCMILPGGTTGQFLRKKSNSCGDVEWTEVSDLEAVVDVREEEQTLASGQTNVDWAVVTNEGLAVYVEGVRLSRGAGASQWQIAAAPNQNTRIVLGKSYPTGTKILGVQNDPLGNIVAPLDRAANLNDLDDKALSRTNLDVYSKAETDQKAPAGLIGFFARNTAPTGWLKANGATVSRTTYAALFSAIGTTFGAGDGSTTFKLPDMRGEFLRGWDDARGIDAGRAFGTLQDHAMKLHAHTATVNSGGDHTHHVARDTYSSPVNPVNSKLTGTNYLPTYSSTGGEASANNGGVAASANVGLTSSAGNHSHSASITMAGEALETRPRNVAALACIKY